MNKATFIHVISVAVCVAVGFCSVSLIFNLDDENETYRGINVSRDSENNNEQEDNDAEQVQVQAFPEQVQVQAFPEQVQKQAFPIDELNCTQLGFVQFPSGSVLKLKVAQSGWICFLTASVNENEAIPVGRSYDGHDWEAVAGPFNTLSYNCDNQGSCHVSLPLLENEGGVFELKAHTYNLSMRDETARFFEQATFGVTEEDLMAVENEVQNGETLLPYFSEWVYAQIYTPHLITSHRAEWRKRTAPIHVKNGREGRATRPCENRSYWRAYAFTEYDTGENVLVEKMGDKFVLSVDGQLRTVLSNFGLSQHQDEIFSLPKQFEICKVTSETNGVFRVMYKGTCRSIVGGNPPVNIDFIRPQPAMINTITVIDSVKKEGRIELMVAQSLNQNAMNCNIAQDKSVFTIINNQALLYEPRLSFQQNYVKNPLQDGGAEAVTSSSGSVECANVARTFLNEDGCKLSLENSPCNRKELNHGNSFKLTPYNLKHIHEETGKFIYAINIPRLESEYHKSPCVHGYRARWRLKKKCMRNIHVDTASIFREIIAQSGDTNAFVRDTFLPNDKQCHQSDSNKINMEFKIGEDCWSTTHPDHANVYDFSGWTLSHPGNSNNSNPIKWPALNQYPRIQYPDHHPLQRWEDNKSEFPYLGRLGDYVDVNNLPDAIRSINFSELFGNEASTVNKDLVVCGSPFEAGTNRFVPKSFAIERRPGMRPLHKTSYGQQRRTIWTMISTAATDQLRQRMAWALSQILIVSSSSIKFKYQTESFLTYYDIFVRNAMGNYKDVLREVAYSPLMAEMLTYLESKSSEYIWNHEKDIQFSDENFAREIMQLFTVGLVKLNNDGTVKYDEFTGKAIPVYGNDDVTEYARLWTGFRRQEVRGNHEERGIGLNSIDPMTIHVQWRDHLPKMGLDGKYIGDQYILCTDLPKDNFLRTGAKYRLLGSSTRSDIQNIQSNVQIPRLDQSSVLYNKLCNPSGGGECSFPGIVYLQEAISCTGIECFLDSNPLVVQMDDEVYYEYVRPACVHFQFEKHKNTFMVIDSEGRVAVERENDSDQVADSLTYFRVHWKNGSYPHIDNLCGEGICMVLLDRCRCRGTAQDYALFDYVPSRDEVLSNLHIGGAPPQLSNYNYERIFPQFKVYEKLSYDQGQLFHRNSTFVIEDDFGRELCLKNMKSSVIILNENFISSSYEFRNPPTFYNHDVKEVRDAQYETEAGLDHYFYHLNTGPFLATALIKRLGISNPSPRFIGTVVQAFQSGIYQTPHHPDLPTFGSGKYGDLAATTAAILLDRESRNVLLDVDPSHGSIREPLLKIIALMRSMKYIQTDENYVSIYDLDITVGQMAHESPSVFSFFLPEYSPPGVLSTASLVSPEAMLLPYTVGLVNGMISLVNFGLSKCYGGFGGNGRTKCSFISGAGDFSQSVGHLSYTPDSDRSVDAIVDDLATLLTSGRMNNYHRNIVKEAYMEMQDKHDALRVAQILTILSPEYHATGNIQGASRDRIVSVPPKKSCKAYKALVHILLRGGCDSFNLLVPHSQCQGQDMYQEYKEVRGSIGLEKEDLLTIDANSSQQVCGTFGIHPNLPFLQQMYESNEASFLAGIGFLSEPVTKLNYQRTKTQLFAHNTQQTEIIRLDPYLESEGTSILGRLADSLSGEYSVNSFSVDTSLVALEGKIPGASKASVNSKLGFKTFDPSPLGGVTDIVRPKFNLMNGEHGSDSSMYGQVWSSSLHNSITSTQELFHAQESVPEPSSLTSQIGEQLNMVTKMIKSNECRGRERDLFYIETGTFDHHSDLLVGLEEQFSDLNQGLSDFTSRLKDAGLWDNVVIMVSSDFGRTLTANSKKGSDHAWSGNSFIMGGSVAGGKILGEYPSNLTDNSPLNVGRGRLIPTMPFEAPWNAAIEWLGVTSAENINTILPNLKSFPSEILLQKDDVFVGDVQSNQVNCQSSDKIASCIPKNDLSDI